MSDQPALTEEALERIRSLHVEWTAKDGQGNPNGPTCSMCLNRWPCATLRVVDRLEALEAALAFYADEDAYRVWDAGGSMRLPVLMTRAVLEDGGQRARAVLGHPGTEGQP